MEFFIFLDKIELEIINLVENAGYSLAENTSQCLLSNKYAGFLNKKEKTIIICTNNAKKEEGYKLLNNRNSDKYEKTSLLIKKALRHEAVHVAQECNDGKLLDIKKGLSINPAKINALKGSGKISREIEKEKQAYILEDNPKKVKIKLEKYCL